MSRKLNIGCGRIFHRDWINVDLIPLHEKVLKIDIRKLLPYKNGEYLYVYSSHVLEHLTKEEGDEFLKEIYRIMKPKGIFRIVVPDLENICLEYLTKLKKVSENKKFLADYQWTILEMIDHMVRSKSGGEMMKYLLKKDITNKDYIKKRIGSDADYYFSSLSNKEHDKDVEYLTKYDFSWYIGRIRYHLLSFIIYILGGTNYRDAFQEGVFRNSGEIHKYMYDRVSLSLLMRTIGFKNIKILDAYRSNIKNFQKYNLDTISGEIRKPNSLFIEATK